MIEKVFISLSGRNQAWFDKKTKKEQAQYLKEHPNSKFGKGTAKKATPKKAAAKKPAKKKVPNAKSSKVVKHNIIVHKNTDEMHGHAIKQKKALIDKLVAPYAKELGRLRNKRDSGEGLTTNEAKRYKQLLHTIQELHKGR
jgi:hypothetical protein